MKKSISKRYLLNFTSSWVIPLALLFAANLHAQSLSLSTSRLNLNYTGGSQSPAQSIQVISSGGSLPWTASTGQSWLRISPSSGTGSGTLQIAAAPAGLAPGSYVGAVRVNGGGSAKTVAVVLSVPSPRLAFASKIINMAGPAGSQAATSIAVMNTGGGTLRWSASTPTPWLKVSPTSATGPGQLNIVANATHMNPGAYMGAVTVSAPGAEGAPAILSIRLQVGKATQTPVKVTVSSPATTVVSGGTLQLSAVVSGSTNKEVIWAASQGTITTTGKFTAPAVKQNTPVTITARSKADSTAVGTIQITVKPSNPTGLTVSKESLAFTKIVKQADPQPQTIVVSSPGGARSWTAKPDKAWLIVTPTSGSTPANVQVKVNTTNLPVGSHTGTIQFSTATGAAVAVRVTLTVKNADNGSKEGFYVSPSGSAKGDGSIDNPWDLKTALAHPAAVKPGDTIWLRGGTYHGTFTSKLTGTPEKPIIVRQYENERATIDTGSVTEGAGIMAYGSDTWFWGFEIMSSYPNRRVSSTGSFVNSGRVDGVDTFGPRNKFINLVVHDTAQGFGYWTPAIDNEIYGCLIYYNGWSAPDRGHGHGIYTQNNTGIKTIEDNIQFYGFGMGLRAYGSENAYAKHIRFLGNVSFNSGYLYGGPTNHWSNYLITVGSGAEDIIFNDNHSYHNTNEDGYSQLGWLFSGVEKDLIAKNNLFIGGESAAEVWNWNKLEFTGNKIYSKDQFMAIVSARSGQKANWLFDRNTYYGSGLLRFTGKNTNWSQWKTLTGLDKNSQYVQGRPTGTWTYVRPNRYEKGRANIVIYNWDMKPSVSVDVSSVLSPGQPYEIRDAMNFYGSPVASGVYSGSPIAVPMQGLKIDPPVGNVNYQPKHTAPEFGTFVLLQK